MLDVATMEWGPALRLSQPRKKLAAAVSGQFVVFAGGYLSGVGNVDTVDIWDAVTGQWSATEHLAVPRFRLQAVAVTDRALHHPLAMFISGQGCDWTCPSADIFDGDLERSTGPGRGWSVANISEGRYEFAAAALSGPTSSAVVLAGGKMPVPKGLNLHQLSVFDAVTRRWSDPAGRFPREHPAYLVAHTSAPAMRRADAGSGQTA